MASTIYFSGAISGGREDLGVYRRIVAALEAAGFDVLAGAVASEDVGGGGEALPPREIFDRDLAWLGQADLVVAEVSRPSIGVGYEIGAARYRLGIPVICLWRPAHGSRCSAMVAGDPGVELIEYRDEEFEAMLGRLIAALQRLSAAPPSG